MVALSESGIMKRKHILKKKSSEAIKTNDAMRTHASDV